MIIGRYAPTPSGHLHLGNILNFFITHTLIQKHGGKILLRIDDADLFRVRDEYLVEIFETLDFFNLKYDLGPKTLGDHKKNWTQELRRDRYYGVVKKGLIEGKLFVCDCSRKILGAETYSGRCQHKKIPFQPGENLIRANVDSYPVLWRRDNIPAYHLTSVVDDHDFNINLIVRGEDLYESTEIQKRLAELLDLKTFLDAKIIHHKLIYDQSGKKLSKTDGALSIKRMRENGETLDSIFHMIKDSVADYTHT